MIEFLNNTRTWDPVPGRHVSKVFGAPVAPPEAPRSIPRPLQAMSAIPASGWGGAPGAGQNPSFDAILNGGAGGAALPQFGQGAPQPPIAGAPTPQFGGPQRAQLPSPQQPQQNFDALGQNLMSQILAQRTA